MITIKKLLLREFTEKTIQTTIARWKESNPALDEKLARRALDAFEKAKQGLRAKIDVLNISDELKKNNNYLNIDKYSYEDLEKLLRSIPEDERKIKSQAVEKFHKEEYIDKQGAQSYVARFMSKKESLKHAVTGGIPELELDAKAVRQFIPKKLQDQNRFLDPRNWTWDPFESMLDALFPAQAKVVDDEGENAASTSGDLIYNQGGLEIYLADDKDKCIKYNPTDPKTKQKVYGWCVTQPGNMNYDHYRLSKRTPTFHIVLNRNKTSEGSKQGGWRDPWHAFVVQKNLEDGGYVVTNATNRGDREAKNWQEVKQIVDAETWNLIGNLESVFRAVPLSTTEKARKIASGRNLSRNEFLSLDTQEKIDYILAKGSTSKLTSDILEVLPKIKVPYEGRTTTLMNVAIDSGQVIPFKILEDYPSLAKRYTIYRSRHDVHGDTPVPLLFVQYLDEPAKEAYIEKFDETLTFDIVDRFFGKEALTSYTDKKAKELDYVDPKYVKYISSPNLQKLYTVLSKMITNWNIVTSATMSDDKLKSQTTAPDQIIAPEPILTSQIQELSTSERKVIVELAKKYTTEEKNTLAYMIPVIIEDRGQYHFLIPDQDSIDTWSLVDMNGKIVDTYDSTSSLGNELLVYGLVGYGSSTPSRIFKKDLLKKS